MARYPRSRGRENLEVFALGCPPSGGWGSPDAGRREAHGPATRPPAFHPALRVGGVPVPSECVASMGLGVPVLHDAQHGSRVTPDTPGFRRRQHATETRHDERSQRPIQRRAAVMSANR
jgi:hypothetical protein